MVNGLLPGRIDNVSLIVAFTSNQQPITARKLQHVTVHSNYIAYSVWFAQTVTTLSLLRAFACQLSMGYSYWSRGHKYDMILLVGLLVWYANRTKSTKTVGYILWSVWWSQRHKREDQSQGICCQSQSLPVKTKYIKTVASSHDVRAKDHTSLNPKDCADVLRNCVNLSEEYDQLTRNAAARARRYRHRQYQWIEARTQVPGSRTWLPRSRTWLSRPRTWLPRPGTWLPRSRTWLSRPRTWLPRPGTWLPRSRTAKSVLKDPRGQGRVLEDSTTDCCP